MKITVDKLCKAYGAHKVLDSFSACFEEGVNCIMAPSGGGKTTLLRLILGLERADSGTISGAEGCRWAAVFQEDRLVESMDAENNLRFALGRGYDRLRAGALLAELGLELSDARPVREYSGGMKRRLAIARALLCESDALAFDEPFSGLDEEARRRALGCILRETAGKSVLLVTHSLEEAEMLNAHLFCIPAV